jgi:hypothetical protein
MIGLTQRSFQVDRLLVVQYLYSIFIMINIIMTLYLQLCVHQEMEQRLIAERDRLQDESAGITITKEEIIQQARADRDQAIERSVAEMSLVISRI